MAIITTKKAYIAIFLMGVIVVIAGISVYSITQSDTSQTPTTIFKELTEADEEIVKENIRSNIEQQKRMETERVEKKRPSYADNMPIENNSKGEKPGHTYEAPAPIVTKADASDTVTSDLQSQSDEIQANMADIEHLHKQFAPKGVDWSNAKSIEINSQDDLKKVLAELKASGKLTDKNIIQIKKSVDVGDGKWVEVEIDDK